MNHTKNDKPVTAKEQEDAYLLQAELAEGLRVTVGFLPEFANDIAARLAGFLRNRLGAQRVYIPAPSNDERDQAILREFDGTNAPALMKRHGVSRTRLYEIVGEQRDRLKAASPLSCLKSGQGAA